ncbi:MG2 domain-containing protein [Chryseobacterium sp.]|uniref:alpha-2-macroglobulin family protein n=1 Tax=Chryseobacterium sp. TaxID=1871047 RepID=UPI0012C071DF|nr:MG2 domain-containing protein [Chryseobacterium sp.]MPS65341.1 hypothetical protein [Chryseobacterium sp.]
MKKKSKIFLLLLFLLNFSTVFAQKYYDEQWKKVSANSQKGIYKSSLPIILDIQKQAMKENNIVQLIQSLKAEFNILNRTRDDEKNDSVSQLFKKLTEVQKQLKGEDKTVFEVLLNSFLMDYYNEHSWEIGSRTNINSQNTSEIETWSKLDFKNYLNKNYQELDQQKAEMRKIALKKYEQVFSYNDYISYFPTLWDWYSIKKIDFFSSRDLFTKNELETNHTIINGIYDELIAQNTGNPKLYFMHKKLQDNCDFTRCKDKLEQLKTLLKSDVNGDYKVLIIGDIVDELVGKNKEKEAIEFINQAKTQYPKSPFIDNIKNKESQILNPSLNIKYEAQTQSNTPIHFIAEYRNVSAFSISIYEVKEDLTSFLQYAKNSYGNPLNKIKKSLVRKEAYPLNDSKDFQTHKTSLEIKPLPSGIYVAEYSVAGIDNKDSDDEKDFYFLVSGNKIIYQKKANNNPLSDELKLVNSENGKPAVNENLTFYEFVGNKTFTKAEGKTDDKGVFKFPATANKEYYRTLLIRQPKTNDFQIMEIYGNRPVNTADQNKDVKESKAQIFTDRAIYRPGQTVYFKVINTQRDKEIESVVAGLQQKITLTDTNGQEVSSQTFTTNEFGSYHGSFVLPKGKLNGTFYLRTSGNNGYFDFRVEEYKRPKFEVTFDPVKEEYKYGQTIELKGKAMMFSGVALSNTTVNYEIRKRNIRWRYFSWYPQDNDNENSILGEAKTNEKGEFTIKLDLKKDEKLDGIQIDNYEINASVTDINGETQTADTQLKVSSVSHYIQAEEIKNVFSGENVKLKVETKNYNEQLLKKSYQTKLSKLQSPDRIFRNNFISEVQDFPKYSKEEFISKFPHDLYDKNDKVENWKSQVLSTKTESSENLDLGKLEAGDYQLELFNIEGKDTIKTVQNFSVWNKNSLQANQKTFLTVVEPKKEFVRGEKALFYVYSSIPDALVNVFVQDGSGKTISEAHQLKNGILEYGVEIPKDKNVQTLNVQFQIVAFNDVETQSVNLEIKDAKEKELTIETVTFRDKIQPNSKEKWSVKVLGNGKEKISAELLANMYDMSLDKFAANRFNWDHFYIPASIVTSYDIRQYLRQKYYQKRLEYFNGEQVEVPAFDWFDKDVLYSLQGRVAGISIQNNVVPAPMKAAKTDESPRMKLQSVRMDDEAIDILNSGRQLSDKEKKGYMDAVYGDTDSELLNKVPVRQNLNETAFFYPDLKTDSEGNVNFEFTSPEALTKWKLMFLAHTKDARAATLEKEVVTQKEFSVTPNYPRFLREGDELNLQSKLSNLTNKKLNGSAQLQILDAFTNEDVSEKFGLSTLTAVPGYNKEQAFSLDENGNSALTWKIKVPKDVSSIILKVVAKAGQYSDGEQKAIAVLPNRMLVTDALPIFVKEGETKTFELENLKNTTSTTISNVSNTLELTTNPIWEIMFALPSLKNDQNNSADVIFNKWFADVLASEIFKANPKMKTIFEEYQNKGLLNSNLEKNQELKQLLLEETPWVLESKNENEQMSKLALLFDINTMRNTIQGDWDDFKKLQNPDGGFSWYQGYPSSYSTSLYILKNLGKINSWLKDNVNDYQTSEQKELIANLVKYVDNEIGKYWDVKKGNVWSNWALDYLDTRNYWEKQYPLKGKGATLKSLVKQKAKTAKITEFTFFGLHRAALLMNNYGLKEVSDKLMTYLKETSVDSKTQGAYWKHNLDDWGWFSSKVVNHAGALEAFNTLKPNDQKFIEDMKIWLITQKEVNSWGSSRGTSEVVFTILNSGKSWTSPESDKATVVWGGKELKPETQATGYVKSSVKTDVIDKNLATVTVTKPGPGIVQGGLFWQYYEDLDKIKSSENYISITKELYKKIKTVNGEELQKISSETPLKVGDKVTVRMILNTDRPMEFIHIKDMRAAGFEPVDVLSGYQWKSNLGYYQSTKDASTNFYIQYMPKGKYVFEYDYVANASGKFSNGITTMQNYYAPQMNSHTKGTNVTISE